MISLFVIFLSWYWLKKYFLAGLYETASGFDSEVLNLQRKFGQWQEDDSSEEHVDLKFYEYVEAVKLTGDNLVPAGQVLCFGLCPCLQLKCTISGYIDVNFALTISLW